MVTPPRPRGGLTPDIGTRVTRFDSLRSPSLGARLFGEVWLTASHRPLPPETWPRRTARSLLLLLLITPGHRIARERAIDLLWPELTAERVDATWYQALSTLRRVLEPDLPPRQPSSFVTVHATTIAFADDLDLWVDIDLFDEMLRAAGAGPPAARRATLRSALSLYQGNLLSEEGALDWAAGRREELHFARQQAVLQLADLDFDAGEPLASIAALQTVVADDPTAESVHRALIRAFLAGGERDRALRQYERCRQVLREELAVEPDDQTQATIAPALPGAQETRPRPRPSREKPPRNLPPAPPTPLVGRAREIEMVEDLLRAPHVRLVTLTGPGGIGKTRVAIEVARLFDEAGTAVVFVPLSAVRSPDLVLPAIAQALGLRGEPAGSLRAAVIQRIGHNDLLLVLDNFAHVNAAAAEVAALLAACPRLTVLVASQAPLHLASEHAFAVPPLSLPATRRPSFAALARSEAVTLFVQRAQAARSGFALTEENAPDVGRICTRLDCLPLAIELAAANVRVLSPRAILSRLDRRLDLLRGGPRDAPARHRTMRAAIDWSYDLLAERERILFRRLAVFAGGASLPAIHWVTTAADTAEGDSLPNMSEAPLTAPDALVTLIDHSLIQREDQADGEPRFLMLETVRAYALERLQESGEATVIQRRHLVWLIAFAEAVLPCLTRSAQAAEVERMAVELDNVRSVLAWALAHDETLQALRLATATFQLWFVRVMPSEGLRWLEESLRVAVDADDIQRTNAMLCIAAPALLQGDLTRHGSLAAQSLATARSSGYEFGVAIALFQLGVAAERRRNLDEASEHYEEALELMRRLGQPYWIALLLSNLADVRLWSGRVAEAATFADEGLVRWRELENDWGIAQGLGTAAAVAREHGDFHLAAELYDESLRRWLALGDRRGIAGTLAGVAGLAESLGAPREAARLLGAAQARGEEAGVRDLAHHFEYERCIAATRLQLDANTFADDWAAGASLALEGAIAAAGTVVEMVRSAWRPAAAKSSEQSETAELQSNVIPLRRRANSSHRA